MSASLTDSVMEHRRRDQSIVVARTPHGAAMSLIPLMKRAQLCEAVA